MNQGERILPLREFCLGLGYSLEKITYHHSQEGERSFQMNLFSNKEDKGDDMTKFITWKFSSQHFLTSQARFTKKRVSTMLFLLAPVALGNGLLHVCVALQVSRANRRLVRASGHGAPITKDLSYWKALGKLAMTL